MRGGRRRVDANQAAIVAALRAAGCSVWCTYACGHGAPDLVVGYRNKTVLMEIKSDEGDRLTPDEQRWHTQWRGGPLVVVRSPAFALWVMGLGQDQRELGIHEIGED